MAALIASNLDTSRVDDALQRLTALLPRADMDIDDFKIITTAFQHGVYIHNGHEQGRYYLQFRPFARGMIDAVLDKYESEL